MTKKNGAKLFAECLVKHGVKYIFGIPGAKIDALFDALIDTPIQVITCRHEQNATFLAAAYGRITGTPGVVLVTSGPGVSNLVTGLLTATTEGDPVVAIGGNVPREMKLKASHQSADNVNITKAATKSSTEVIMANNIPEIVDNAFRQALEPMSGAVFISIPQDVLLEETTISCEKLPPKIQYGAAPDAFLETAAKWLNEAKNPVILLGQEASRPMVTQWIRNLLKKNPIPTVGTYQAAGVISRDLLHCFVGRVGLFKNQPGDTLVDLADLVLTIGFNPVEYDPEIWNATKHKKIIHLNHKPADIHLTYIPDIELLGKISTNIEKLIEKLDLKRKNEIPKEVRKLQNEILEKIENGAKKTTTPIHPLKFIYELRNYLDDETTVVCDIGTHYMWMARYFFSYEPHHLLFSNGQQTLGVALPWAMAATLARPNKKVVSISGDGGFLFSAMELETAVREKMHFVHFVWCDGTYNMVLEQQHLKYKRDTAVHFGHINLVKFAESFGAHGFKIDDPKEIIPTLKKALQIPGPVIIEVSIDYSENLELFKTVKDLGN